MADISQIEVNGTTYDICDATARDSLSQILEVTPAVSHRNIYRGKYLGTSVTSAQWAAISSATFDDLYVGDYWTMTTTISNTTYTRNMRIWDINYYYGYGDTAFTTNHLVVGPDTSFYNMQMNSSNTTAGHYRGSTGYKSGLANAITIVNNYFGSSHTKSHREFFNDSVTNGYPSQWNSSTNVWGDTKKVELCSEDQVYGHPHFRPGTFYYTGTNTTVPANHSISQRQLAIFKLNPAYLCNRENWWLKDVASSAYFCFVNSYGLASFSSASTSFGVRPLSVIG